MEIYIYEEITMSDTVLGMFSNKALSLTFLIPQIRALFLDSTSSLNVLKFHVFINTGFSVQLDVCNG